MAISPALIKAAIYAATDKRFWIALGSVIVGVIFFIIIIFSMFFQVFVSDGNNQPEAPASYQSFVSDMQACYRMLDAEVDTLNQKIQAGKLDKDEIHAVFYTLYFGEEKNMPPAFYTQFVDCFVEQNTDENGNSLVTAVNKEAAYQKLEDLVGYEIPKTCREQIDTLYAALKYGAGQTSQKEDHIASVPPEALTDSTFVKLMTEATKYIGFPYVWGGSTPATSFDCSGFICWSYTNSGVYNLPRTTAQGIYEQCEKIDSSEAKPGDLIFFTGTYTTSDAVTHLGIYCGGNTMLHCGNPIGYASIQSDYWSSHFYGFGRLITAGKMSPAS